MGLFVRYGYRVYYDVFRFAVVGSLPLDVNAPGNFDFPGSNGFLYQLVEDVVRVYAAAMFHYLKAFLMFVTKSAKCLATSFSANFSAEVNTSRPLLST